VLHFKLKIRQKSFAGHAPPGPASGAYSALQTASWTEGVASMEGVKGTGKEGRITPKKILATTLSNAILPMLLWRNVEVSYHKHFVDFSGNQHRHLLPGMCHNLRHAGRAPPATALTTPACRSVNTGSQARHRLRIAISAYPTCIRRSR